MDDPLDGDLQAMDEDSQESLTLKNAIKPLSDTQPSRSQDHERSQPATAHPQDGLRLLSRPQDNIVDPAASFTYGKPLKIIPGKFGRVAPSKPINHDPEDILGGNVHGASNGLAPENPRAVYEQVQPLLRADTRKPLPVEDHLPQNLPTNSGDRLQGILMSSSSRDPPDVRNTRVAHKDGAGSTEIETSRPHPPSDYHKRDSEMAFLARHLEKQQSKLSRYKKQAEGGTNAIRQLEESHAQLQEELLAANQQLADRSEKTSKLEGKCRQYREYLNSAIAEQQSLYKAASAKQAEATLDRLKQAVKMTVAECGFEKRELNNKIETVNEKLKHQEAALSREQETTQKLLQQEEAITSVQEAVKSIGSQIEQVAIKLTDAATRQVSQDETAARKTHSKLDNIVDRLSVLEKQIVPSTDIVQRLQEVNAETFASILGQVLSSQAEAHADVKKLSDGLENYMEDFWMKLEDREEVLTELLEQVKAENEQLGIHLQLKEEEYSALSNRLTETETIIQSREEELSALKDEIAVVEQAQADGIQEAARANLLHHECEKLKNDLAAKSTLASELQRRLQESEIALAVQGQEHARSTERLHSLWKQREEEARASQNVAVELARQEAVLEMNKAKEDLQMLLSQAEGDRATLQADLDTARQKISSMEDEGIRGSATVKELESELQMAQSRAVHLSVEATSKETDHQQMIDQHTMLIRDLEAKLADKEKAVSQLSEDVLAYDKQAQKLLDVLKQWTLENKAVKELASQLEMVEHGNLDGIDPSFKPLLEIDMLHKVIFRYCQSQEGTIPEAAKTKHGIERRTGEKQEDRADIQDHPPSSPPEPMPQYTVANKILDQFRRVTIKSPSGIAPSPRPPSVNTEQARRRTGDQPRSIMKFLSYDTLLVEGNDKEEQARPIENEHYSSRGALTGTTQRQLIAAPHHSQDEEEIRQPGLPSRGGSNRRTQGRPSATAKSRQEEQEVQQEPVEAERVLNHGGYNRGPYNRLVAGTKSRPDGSNVRSRSLKIELSKGSCDQDASTGQAHTPREPQKRKQLFPQESEMSRKRTKPDSKREKSLFSTPCSPPEQSTKQQHMMPVPSAPRKRGHRPSIVGLQPNSPIRGSQSAPDWHASRTPNVVTNSTQNALGQRTSSSTQSMSSQETSQDKEALYYERRRSIRGNEESQDSIAHSQDMRGGNEMSVSHTRRFQISP
ncbi:hypothetical protein VPNG_06702 [Cytospora leucostoma]|uniref:Uncharacterized protein n=1 Tax=Cytospora leucostoma TaxID=1230097 RepID=A0A423WTJ2_9PEZI|nr:hypothetical protein VPNG_06702 [Cytospora leucostoma]